MRISRLIAAFALCGCWAATVCGQTSAPLTIRDFFDDTQLQIINLTVNPADWSTLQQNYLDDDYYQATFAWRGITQTVGIRSHGNGSRSPIKPNLDVNISKYLSKQTFLSINFFVLIANNEDASMLHELITFKLFTKMGLPAPRVAPARVYLNGEYFGLYNIVEHEDVNLLQRNFGETGGYLYEWNPAAIYNFEYLGPDPNLYSAFLDLKTAQTDPDVQWFVDMVTAINLTSDADFLAAVSQYLNPQLYLTHAAIENVLSDNDGIVGGVDGTNNFFLYRFQNSNLSQLIVWDKDLTFWDVNRDIFDGTQTNVLMMRLLAIPAYRTVYLDALNKAANLTGGAGGWADQEVTSEYKVIQAAADSDPFKQCLAGSGLASCGAADFETAVTAMHTFLAQRQGIVQQLLATAGYVAPTGEPSVSAATIAAPNGSSTLAAGTLVNLAISNVGTATGTPFTRSFGNVFFAVNGVRAPIAAVSGNQATVQLPWDIAIGTASIVPIVGGQPGNSLDVQVAAASPGILAITHGDGAPVSTSQPANVGEALTIWTLGLGDAGAYFDPGVPATPGMMFNTVNVPIVTIAGNPVPVAFSGLAPGFVGLYQVNVGVPIGVPPGSTTLGIQIGSQMTESTIAIAGPMD
jgi:uncharacterized protein (TIGR03437 family)